MLGLWFGISEILVTGIILHQLFPNNMGIAIFIGTIISPILVVLMLAVGEWEEELKKEKVVSNNSGTDNY